MYRRGDLLRNLNKILGVLVLLVVALTVLHFAIGATNQASSSTSTINNNQLSSYVPCTNGSVCFVNQRVGNFVLMKIDAVNQTISGEEWIMYPVASDMPRAVTLHVGDSIGYKCNGAHATLIAINETYAQFMVNGTISGGCPI